VKIYRHDQPDMLRHLYPVLEPDTNVCKDLTWIAAFLILGGECYVQSSFYLKTVFFSASSHVILVTHFIP